MKHRAAKLVLFLLLGAVINIAFAWGLSLFIDPFSLDNRTAIGARHARDSARIVGNQYRYANVSSCFGAARMLAGMRDPTALDQVYGDDPREIVPRWWDAGWYRDPENTPRWVRAEARGWPMLSMWHEVRYRDHAFGRGRMQSPGGIELPLSYWLDPTPYSNYDQPRTLPLRLIWSGFAVNTIFYAAIAWLLFAAPFAIRRRRRIKRGLCPACAYPIALGTSDVCSECGQRIVEHRRIMRRP